MAVTTVDKAGRIVIPKAMRDRLHLAPGTQIEVVDSGDRLELIPPDHREAAVLVEKDGLLVISAATGRGVTLDESLDLRDALRDDRAG
jgi:AbrB family looped-hinge helix DNA binding protein